MNVIELNNDEKRLIIRKCSHLRQLACFNPDDVVRIAHVIILEKMTSTVMC